MSSNDLPVPVKYRQITDVAILHQMLVERDLRIDVLNSDIDTLQEQILRDKESYYDVKEYYIPLEWQLTAQETQVLECLLGRVGAVVTKEAILAYAWANKEVDGRIVDVIICKIRKKLANAGFPEDALETVWGRGYMLQATYAPLFKAERIKRDSLSVEQAVEKILRSFGVDVAFVTTVYSPKEEVDEPDERSDDQSK